MPHRKIRAARKKVEGAQERGAETKAKAKADLRRASDAVARRTVPIENEVIQSRREAALLARQLGSARLAQRAGSARERLAGIELGQIDGGEMGALAQIDALEQEAYGDGGVLASVDEQIIESAGGIDVVDTMDLDNIVDDMEGRF